MTHGHPQLHVVGANSDHQWVPTIMGTNLKGGGAVSASGSGLHQNCSHMCRHQMGRFFFFDILLLSWGAEPYVGLKRGGIETKYPSDGKGPD